MKYPSLIKKGDTIGICAPSTGAPGEVLGRRLDNAIRNIEAIGYQVIETESVRKTLKCVSADAEIRAKEFMELYENPSVSVIMPPWGGEFLMDMLPHLDYEKLKQLPPKWICGYSDMTTLSFVLTACCDIATVHGSNLLNMGYASIHKSDMKAFDVMSNITTRQESFEYYGGYTSWDDFSGEVYKLDQPSCWKSLDHSDKISFAGMMIGGCMDVLCKLLGTKYAPVNAFIEKYKDKGFIWTLESCEMAAPDIYRTLWQMNECGWFKYCNGILFGRPDGYRDKRDFNLTDAYSQGVGNLNIPVIYNADIGHIPPQIQIINGSLGKVEYNSGKTVITQTLKI